VYFIVWEHQLLFRTYSPMILTSFLCATKQKLQHTCINRCTTHFALSYRFNCVLWWLLLTLNINLLLTQLLSFAHFVEFFYTIWLTLCWRCHRCRLLSVFACWFTLETFIIGQAVDTTSYVFSRCWWTYFWNLAYQSSFVSHSSLFF